MTQSDAKPDARAALLSAACEELIEHGHAAISLRAAARRAGLSHAAPKHHFGDRAGLLTAVATEGFALLGAELRAADPALGDLGRAYIDFALANPALFDLMFRPSELHPEDALLQAAQRRALEVLESAASGGPDGAVMSWALAHGLAVLARDGALQGSADTAHRVAGEFAVLLSGAPA